MKKIRFLALLLALSLVLCGCDMAGFWEEYDRVSGTLTGYSVTHYRDMEYTRPEVETVRESLDAACDAAEGTDLDAILEGIYSFYDAYDWFYTCYSLADIRYSRDLTDIYWEQEYGYCMENSGAVDAMLEELYYALAKSPCRETLEGEDYFGADYFDSYEGENPWEEGFTGLLEREAELQGQYYDLSTAALKQESGSAEYYDANADDMAQLLAELIEVRLEMAQYWGYTDYVQFANDFYYYRDYTPQQMEAYLADIQTELVELYRTANASDVWVEAYAFSGEDQTFDFVRQTAANMGGIPWEAFQLLEEAGLYDIAEGENKYDISFEVYLTSYAEPFIFMNPEMARYDCLTFAHEFGHFCNDYASYGSYAGIDVLEVFSQGMEYLSLCYGRDTEDLTRIKMADSLCVYVEQAAFAEFERRMYALPEEERDPEGLYRLYEEVAEAYGFDSVDYDRREFVEITHFYTNPMYIFSYIVSNDAAMQLYQLEQEEEGAGLAKLEKNLATQEAYFLTFLEIAGLESPFAEGRLQQVRETFEQSMIH